LDNITQPIFSLLVAHKLIEDDSKVAAINSRWDRTVDAGQVLTTIKKSSSPASRIGAETRKRISVANAKRQITYSPTA
jgi:hypothetical protein